MNKRVREAVTEDPAVKETRLNEGILLEGTPRIDSNRSQIMVKIGLEGVQIHSGTKWVHYGLRLSISYRVSEAEYQQHCEKALQKFKQDWFK